MPLPVKIDPCPIKQAIIELRFESTVDENVLFALLFGQLNNSYPRLEKDSIAEIPSSIRKSNPNFASKPLFRFHSDSGLVQVGENNISVVVNEPYPGWSVFVPETIRIFEILRSVEVVKKVSRLGIRYINSFDEPILPRLRLQFVLNNATFDTNRSHYRAEIPSGRFLNTLQLVQARDVDPKPQSTIDIDTFTEDLDAQFFDSMGDILEEGHIAEKELFFSLLTDEFLATFNPEYE